MCAYFPFPPESNTTVAVGLLESYLRNLKFPCSPTYPYPSLGQSTNYKQLK